MTLSLLLIHTHTIPHHLVRIWLLPGAQMLKKQSLNPPNLVHWCNDPAVSEEAEHIHQHHMVTVYNIIGSH